jgi:hypothetical protein
MVIVFIATRQKFKKYCIIKIIIIYVYLTITNYHLHCNGGFFLRGLYFHFLETPDYAKGHLGNTTFPNKTLWRTHKPLLPTGNRTAALRHYSPQPRDSSNYATLPPHDRNLSRLTWIICEDSVPAAQQKLLGTAARTLVVTPSMQSRLHFMINTTLKRT